MKSLLPIILIIAAIGVFFIKVNPLFSEVKQLRVESKEYDEALAMAEELEQIRGDLAKTLEGFSPNDLERLEHFLPRSLDTVRIILDVDGIADKNSIRLNDLKVTDPTPVSAQRPTAARVGAATTAVKGGHNTVGVSFGFNSTYSQGLRFVQDLQKSLRLLDTVSLTVRPAQDSKTNYDFQMTMQTYWINR